ncbi:hypothetical protein D2917_20320 [Cupriavidus oxalaticus]|uniref:HTH marR-type domain-containing protein n=2 Tax=Cupriavidus oxalaticus TaxID=96344 RepID=A0A5P3VJV0_9BURK|nr:hypothetical protein D2917_20320 [Cupriavidus oxalaticus]
MERDELISRAALDGDKRKTVVLVSERGRELFEQSLLLVLRYYSDFLNGISPSEMTVFMEVLKKIKTNAQTFDSRDIGRDL